MKKASQSSGWPLRIAHLFAHPPSAISTPISVLAISAFALLVCIGLLAIGWLLVDLLSGDRGRAADATKAALPILAGVIGLPLIVWRLVILDRQTKISEAKTQIDRETHYTSIFSRAIEQLGQTRELKRATEALDAANNTSVTVPNIEVRLGGIHSLTRLAEESVRDRKKIQNVLLAYVRGNSWSDRNGSLSSPLQQNNNPAHRWTYYYREGGITSEIEAELKSWMERETERLKQSIAWAGSLTETRVDVSEAIEAISEVLNDSSGTGQPTFYECLFVATRFSAQTLELCHFERCTFVRCTFARASEYRFSNCTLVDSYLSDVHEARIVLSRCKLYKVRFRNLANSTFSLRASNASDLTIEDVGGSNIHISFTTIYKPWISGAKEAKINLHLENSSLASGRLASLKLNESSMVFDCALADTQLDFVDLSAVERISVNALARTKGNAGSLPPATQSRPFLWQDFDPNYTEDDDIPF